MHLTERKVPLRYFEITTSRTRNKNHAQKCIFQLLRLIIIKQLLVINVKQFRVEFKSIFHHRCKESKLLIVYTAITHRPTINY